MNETKIAIVETVLRIHRIGWMRSIREEGQLDHLYLTAMLGRYNFEGEGRRVMRMPWLRRWEEDLEVVGILADPMCMWENEEARGCFLHDGRKKLRSGEHALERTDVSVDGRMPVVALAKNLHLVIRPTSQDDEYSRRGT